MQNGENWTPLKGNNELEGGERTQRSSCKSGCMVRSGSRAKEMPISERKRDASNAFDAMGITTPRRGRDRRIFGGGSISCGTLLSSLSPPYVPIFILRPSASDGLKMPLSSANSGHFGVQNQLGLQSGHSFKLP